MDDNEALNELLTAGSLRGGKFGDQMANARRLQELAYRQAVAQPDTSGLLKMGLGRETEGLTQQGLGYGTAIAGPREAAPLAAAQFKEGMDKQAPMELGQGWYSGGQYVEDPYKRQGRLTQALGGQAKAQEQFGEAEGKERARVSEIGLHGAQAGAAGAQAALAKSQMEMGKIGKFKGADDQEHLYRLRSDGSIEFLDTGGAGTGMGATDILPKHATETDKKTYSGAREVAALVPALIEQVKANPKAFGWGRGAAESLGGMIGTGAVNVGQSALTPEESKARALVYERYSTIINSLIGAAQSEKERQSLRPFIPQPGEKWDSIINKMEAAVAQAQSQKEMLRGAYGLQQPRAAAPAIKAPTGAPRPGESVRGNW